MVYKQQNFFENLQNAIEYKDFDAMHDAMASEIGTLAHQNKPLLVKAVQKAGIAIPDDITDENLLKVIISNYFNGKEKVIGNVLKAIAMNMQKKEAMYSNDITGIGSIVSGAGALVSGITGLLSEKGKTKQAEQATDQAKYAMLTAAVNAKTAAATAGATEQAAAASSNTMLYAVGIIAVVGLLGLVAWKALDTGGGGGAPAAAK